MKPTFWPWLRACWLLPIVSVLTFAPAASRAASNPPDAAGAAKRSVTVTPSGVQPGSENAATAPTRQAASSPQSVTKNDAPHETQVVPRQRSGPRHPHATASAKGRRHHRGHHRGGKHPLTAKPRHGKTHSTAARTHGGKRHASSSKNSGKTSRGNRRKH